MRIATSVLILFFCTAGVASAEETAGDYFTGMSQNLGRGLLNLVTSPADIPCTMVQDTQDAGPAGLATGFGKGIAFMLRRILVGAAEIGTFVLPSERTIPPVCHEQ
jgi:putative exosortase-associated protein (TIGR04073 family)